MALSSPGVGSNLDVNGIVSQLMALEHRPLNALDRKEAGYQAQLSAYGSLKGALSAFQNAVRGLSELSKFQAVKATPADTTILTASAASTAIPGSYSVEVTKLAQAHKISSNGFASVNDAVGSGTLTIQYGTYDSVNNTFTLNSAKAAQTVTIGAGQNTLAGIRDAINAAKIGVTASIVNDGSANGNKLVLSSNDMGAANSLKITVTNDSVGTNTDTLGLSQLAYDPTAAVGSGKNLTQTVAAQNAELKVDGILVSKAANTVTDVIQGVTLNLLKTNTAAPTTLTVARDTAAVKSSVEAFVKAYNDINKTFKDLSGYNATTKQGAILQGDAAVRTIQTQIRSTLTSTLTGLDGAYKLLSQIGVSFQKDGTLTVDSTKLQSAIDTNFNDIAGLFAALGKPSDSRVSYAGATAKTKPGVYGIEVTSLAIQGKSAGGAAIGTYTITAGSNDALTLKVDGISASITIAAGTYTAATLAAELQSKINGASALSSAGISVKVAIDAGNVVTITSDRYGSASNVEVTGGNGRTNLGFATQTLTAGADVVGKINGANAVGSGQYLTGATGNDAEGLKLLITGTATGSRGSVNYSHGYAYKLDKLADSLLASSGPISSSTDGIDRIIKDIGNRREVMNRRLISIESRYRAQFTALDQLMSSMTKTSNYLSQQLANLPKV